MYIIGAGMAGCLAGVMNPTAQILEMMPAFKRTHDAVLRFRDDSVSKQVGIPFKKVKVNKGIFVDGYVKPNIQYANMYSMKVTDGKIMDRSIWNTEPSIRYVAPSDFHNMLEDMCHSRISYKCEFKPENHVRDPIISTMPMNKLAQLLKYEFKSLFNYRPITVDRFKVANCDVHQTVYFPAFETPIYRITLTGEDLIVESVHDQRFYPIEHTYDVILEAFGIPAVYLEQHEASIQSYGKIEPIDDAERKKFMHYATLTHNIYSLGRFATWRNILLDDVLNDIFMIRKFMNSSEYDYIKRLL